MIKDKKAKILIVDDVEINRIILKEILEDEYFIIEAEDGVEALSILLGGEDLPVAVLLDIMMPELDGHEVLKIMKANPDTCNIPVIFITAADAKTNESKGLSAGAVEYIEKPFIPEVVKLRVSNQVELQLYRMKLEEMVRQKADEMVSLRDKMLETMSTMIEYRSLESGQHISRTCILSRILIEHMLLKPKFSAVLKKLDYEVIIKAVPLHDIGKIGIPDNILLKPGRLTPEEFEIIKTHSTIGSSIIDSLLVSEDGLYLRHCRDICRYHHERIDGKGYPDGLTGNDIPLSARIVSVVDVYDALTSPRVYKPPFSHDEAIRIIVEGAGTQFDADIVEVFKEIEGKIKEVDEMLLERDLGQKPL